MIYGYLRVSTDKQDIESQRQGVDGFAKSKGWEIDDYVTDEGVSGGKDPSKRNLGPLLKLLKKDDVIIASEISRLGRDLFMVMDILHLCMNRGCRVYTVKDHYELGNDIQSKVLAFAFGLSAEIERQLLRQRTQEGLRRRMALGVLLGRPLGVTSPDEAGKYYGWKDRLAQMCEWGMNSRQIAKVIGCDRNTVFRLINKWRLKCDFKTGFACNDDKRRKPKTPTYKDDPYKIVQLDREKMTRLIMEDKTLPQIKEDFPEYTYEQLYDTVLCDSEFNPLYRAHGHLKLVRQRKEANGRQE